MSTKQQPLEVTPRNANDLSLTDQFSAVLVLRHSSMLSPNEVEFMRQVLKNLERVCETVREAVAAPVVEAQS